MPDTSDHPPKPTDFVSQSDWRGFQAILRDYGLIVGLAFLSDNVGGWLAYLLAVWVIGLIQLGLGETLTHEAAHYNLFKTRRLNQWSQIFCCYPFGFTLDDYRREHREHHRLLNTSLEELHQDYRRHGLLDENRNMIWLWFVKPVLGYAGLAYLRSLGTLATARSAPRILLFWALLLGCASWGGWIEELFLYWLVPLLWSFASFFYWSEVEDHFNTESGTRTNIGWTNWLTHNNGFHTVHHRYPRIPWYHLKEAHFALCGDATDVSRGFLDTFRQISTNLPVSLSAGGSSPPRHRCLPSSRS